MNLGLNIIKSAITDSAKFYADTVNEMTYGVKNVKIASSILKATDNCSVPVKTYVATKSLSFKSLVQVGAGLVAGDMITQRIYPAQKDKRFQSLMGGVVTVVTTQVGTALTNNKLAGIAIGISAGVVTALVKSSIDSKGMDNINKDDVYATAIGSATMGIALLF